MKLNHDWIKMTRLMAHIWYFYNQVWTSRKTQEAVGQDTSENCSPERSYGEQIFPTATCAVILTSFNRLRVLFGLLIISVWLHHVEAQSPTAGRADPGERLRWLRQDAQRTWCPVLPPEQLGVRHTCYSWHTCTKTFYTLVINDWIHSSRLIQRAHHLFCGETWH